MPLKIVYGVSGSGKTAHCFKQIENIIDTSASRVVYMVPEQYSLETERKISAKFSEKAMDRVEVLGFERLADRVFSTVGPAVCDFLDDNSKMMIIEKVLIKLRGKLTYFTKDAEVTGFAGLLLDIIKMLKTNCITAERLYEVAKMSDSEKFKYKMYDLSLILNEYNSFFDFPYADSDDNPLLLAKKIEEFGLFGDTYVFLDGYVSFSKQQLAVLRALMKNCLCVTVALTCDSLGYKDDFDLFFRSKITADTLYSMAADDGVCVFPNLYLNPPDCSFGETEFLKQNYFSVSPKIYEKPTENLAVCKSKNKAGEAELAAAEICRLVREENYRYGDIAVVVKDVSEYASVLQNAFSGYGIFYNIDRSLASQFNFIHSAMMSIFEIVISNYSFDSVFGFVKSPFCNLCDKDKFLLENYVIEVGNTPSLWKGNGEVSFAGSFSDYEFELVKKAVRYVKKCISAFTDNFSGRKSVSEIVKAYSLFLEHTEAETVVKNIVSKMRADGKLGAAAELLSAFNHIITSLNRMELYFGDEKITFEKFYKILLAGIKNTDLDKIPTGVDDVTVTSVERFQATSARAVFVLGVCEGSIPCGYVNEGILKDDELLALGIDESVLKKHCDENYKIYRIFASAKEKLYLSYPCSDSDGGGVAASSVIHTAETIFPRIKRMQNVFEKLNPLDGLEGVVPTYNKVIANSAKGFWQQPMIWFKNNIPSLYETALAAQGYINTPKKLVSQNVETLYKTDGMKSSISRIEQYNRCAFAYFVRYGLNVRERNEFEISSSDYGSYMHEIIELYSKFADSFGWKNIDKSLCEKKAEEITIAVLKKSLSDFYTESERHSYLFKKTVKIMKTALWNITCCYAQSEFVSFGYEVEFDENGVFPPIEIELSGGRKVSLRGKVDRIDLRRTESGDLVCIVDYKSSKKDIDFEKILCGIQVQLPVYLRAVCDGLSKRGENALPAAMLYYHIADPVVSGAKNMSDEEIKKKVFSELKMRGIVLENDSFSGVYTVKKNVTAQRIEKICRTAYSKISDTLEKIVGGNIDINPLRVSGRAVCEYCPYGNVCNFDASFENNRFRSCRNIDMEEFFDYVGKMDG